MTDIYLPANRFIALATAIADRSGGTISIDAAKVALCEADVWPSCVRPDLVEREGNVILLTARTL
jgi:hypothetical protein